MSELHVCATCDEMVGDDHPPEWLLPDGTWTHDEPEPRKHYVATVTLQSGARRILHDFAEAEADATELFWTAAHALDLDVDTITVREV